MGQGKVPPTVQEMALPTAEEWELPKEQGRERRSGLELVLPLAYLVQPMEEK